MSTSLFRSLWCVLVLSGVIVQFGCSGCNSNGGTGPAASTPPPQLSAPPPPGDGIAKGPLPPTITLLTPRPNSSDIAVQNLSITATFDQDMDPSSLTSSTFTLVDAANHQVPGTVTYAARQATFAPSSQLALGALYTATIDKTVHSQGNIPLVASMPWSFKTVSGSGGLTAFFANAASYLRSNLINIANGLFGNAPHFPIVMISDGDDVASAIAVDHQGNIVVAGQTTGTLSAYSNAASITGATRPANTIDTDVFLIKYNSAGVEQWAKIYRSPGVSNDVATSMAIDANNNVYITGQSEETSAQGSVITPVLHDPFTIAFDSTGNMLWKKAPHYDGDQYASAVLVTGSGIVNVIGSTNASIPDIALERNARSASSTNYDAFILQYDARQGFFFVGANADFVAAAPTVNTYVETAALGGDPIDQMSDALYFAGASYDTPSTCSLFWRMDDPSALTPSYNYSPPLLPAGSRCEVRAIDVGLTTGDTYIAGMVTPEGRFVAKYSYPTDPTDPQSRPTFPNTPQWTVHEGMGKNSGIRILPGTNKLAVVGATKNPDNTMAGVLETMAIADGTVQHTATLFSIGTTDTYPLLTVDSGGLIYVVGTISGTFGTTALQGSDLLVLKYDSNLNPSQ